MKNIRYYEWTKSGIYERLNTTKKEVKSKDFLLELFDDEEDEFFKSLKNEVKVSSPKVENKKDQRRRYWTNHKFWSVRQKVMGFQGRWKTSLSIIFERDAYRDHKGIEKAIKSLKDWIRRVSGEQAAISVLEYGEIGGDTINRQSTITPHFHCLLEVEVSKDQINKLKKMIKKHVWNNFEISKVRDEDKVRRYVSKKRKGKMISKGEIPRKWDQSPLKCFYTHKLGRDRILLKQVGFEKSLIGLLSYFDDYHFTGVFERLSGKKILIDGVGVLLVENVKWEKFSRLEKIVMGFNLLNTIKRDGGTWDEWREVFKIVIGKNDEALEINVEGKVEEVEIDRWYHKNLNLIKESERPKNYQYIENRPFYSSREWFNSIRPAWNKEVVFADFREGIHPRPF